jgi:hypothetical protein
VGRFVGAARDEVHHAAERAGTVEHRPRAANDLDALDVVEIRSQVVADVRRPQPVVVHRLTVEQYERPVPVVAGAPEAAEPELDVAAVVRRVHAAHAPQRLGDRRVMHRAQLLVRHHADRAGGVAHFLDGARRGFDLGHAHELHLDLRGLVGRDRRVALDRAESLQRNADAVRARRHREDRRRESAGPAVDVDDGVPLVGVDDQRSGERHQLRAHGHGGARRDVDEDRRGLRPRTRQENRVLPRRDRHVARRGARDRRVLGVDVHLAAAFLCDDANGAQDAHQRERDAHFLAERHVDGRTGGVLVAR